MLKINLREFSPKHWKRAQIKTTRQLGAVVGIVATLYQTVTEQTIYRAAVDLLWVVFLRAAKSFAQRLPAALTAAIATG